VTIRTFSNKPSSAVRAPATVGSNTQTTKDAQAALATARLSVSMLSAYKRVGDSGHAPMCIASQQLSCSRRRPISCDLNQQSYYKPINNSSQTKWYMNYKLILEVCLQWLWMH